MPGLHFVQGALQVIAALVKGCIYYLFCTGKELNTGSPACYACSLLLSTLSSPVQSFGITIFFIYLLFYYFVCFELPLCFSVPVF